jgi:uncharacterized damage-inducible protein DinB
MMTREETLERLAESRRALHQAIQGLGEEEMTQVQVEGVWTIKDVLGHITCWEETCLEPLRRYADGGPFEVEVIRDYLAWNDEQAACKRDVPLDVILDELATVRQGLVDAARRLSADQWKQRVTFPWGSAGTVAEGLDGLRVHELEHVHAIQQWRRSSH